jgi:hypothetical protein
MNDLFYYEHIGHMQFSVLTLKALSVIENLTKGQIDIFVSLSKVANSILSEGFSQKQVYGELDRFCYGFECIERIVNNERQIALTPIGKAYIDSLVAEAPYQSSQLAILMRPAKRRNHHNVTIQESTFFDPIIYNIIAKYKFRKGPARDFIKCISNDLIEQFITESLDGLSGDPSFPKYSLDECIKQVQKYGKYWASVGGKYSWFVFAQKYILQMNSDQWDKYNLLIERLIRPPEWGGGKIFPYKDILALLDNKDNISLFQRFGIIRAVWPLNKLHFQLTAPGYLMAERKFKGFIYEFRIRKNTDNKFEISLCDASDFVNKNLKTKLTKEDSVPSLVQRGTKDTILSIFKQSLGSQNSLFPNQYHD